MISEEENTYYGEVYILTSKIRDFNDKMKRYRMPLEDRYEMVEILLDYLALKSITLHRMDHPNCSEEE